MDILQIENVSFRYPNATDQALCDLSFRVNAGEFVVLCGASGCGKTTLLRLLKRRGSSSSSGKRSVSRAP